MERSRRVRLVALSGVALLALVVAAGPGAAHAGGLRGEAAGGLDVPQWLFLATGGGAVGASFLLASFVTDRVFVRSLHERGGTFPSPGRAVELLGKATGVLLLAVTVFVGYVGPAEGARNFAVLFVWVGWWGGYVASTYLVGNTWPALNPFRTVAELFPSLDLPYPERLGAWPSVAGLLLLVWTEVVTPMAADPVVLSTVVLGYGLATVAGAVAFGPDRWFSTVDPISRALAYYGRVAPLERTADGVRFRLPGMALSEPRLVAGPDEVAFVVSLLYVTTYDGFIATGLWASAARRAVDLGFPPLVGYLAGYLAGFALFLAAYWWSVDVARRYSGTYLTRGVLARRFAPSLLAIAAGYHLAHNLGVFLTLLPTLAAVGASPLAPPHHPPVLASLPGWISGVEMALVLLGHFVAVWVAHAAAYDLLPGRLEAVKSQYGVTAVMIFYTMVSLWIVTQPHVDPPFL